ncbi:MAG: hypothetical protein KGN36_03395 [Acidobacteriota bacterium]|nr:hypothetical protein [Acidobacteriota bacterium]
MIAAVVGLFLITIVAFGQDTPAPPTAPGNTTAPIGASSSETVQVNIVNPAALAYNVVGYGVTCTGTLTFYNASGAPIGTAVSVKVVNAQVFSAKLPYASIGASELHTVVWAAITLTGAGSVGSGAFPPPSASPCALSTSIEVYDTATGVIHAMAGTPVTLAGTERGTTLRGRIANQIQ